MGLLRRGMVLCGLLCVSALVCAQAKQNNVLLISSYHPSFPTFFQQINGLKSALANHGTTLDVEFMDSKRFVSEAHKTNFLSQLTYKLTHGKTKSYDVVVVSDDNALHFALKHHKTLLNSRPLVFLGVNNVPFAIEQNHNPLVTGIVEAVSMRKTIELAKAANPNLKQVVGISDGTRTGKANKTKFKTFIGTVKNLEIKVLCAQDLTFAQIAQELRALDPTSSAVIRLGLYRDAAGNFMNLREGYDFVTANANAPLYTLWQHHLQYGSVGGHLISHEAQGYKAGELVALILDGRSPATIPVVEDSPNQYMIDFAQMAKFGLNPASLPDETILLNKTPTFWEQHYKVLEIAALVVGFLLLVVVGLSWSLRVKQAAKEAIVESQSRFELAVAGANDGIWEWEVPSNTVFYSERFCALLGYTPSDFGGDTEAFNRVLHPDDVDATWEKVNQHLESRVPYDVEFRMKHKHGGYRWFQSRGQGQWDKTGKPLKMAGSVRDVTDRIMAERATQAAAENLRITLNSIGDAVIATDEHGVVNQFNNAASVITGLHLEEAIGKHLDIVLNMYHSERDEMIASPMAVLKPDGAESALRRGRWRIKHTSGSYHDVNELAAPITSEDGTVMGTVIVFSDQTDLLHMEKQLQQARKMDSIGQLAGGVAHDFNNMLGGILGIADLLKHRVVTDEVSSSYVQTIVDASQRAADLTAKLLAFSRKGKVLNDPLDLHQCIRDSITLLERSIDKRIQLDVALDAQGRTVEGDFSQLQNVFLNLGLNARDAMEDGGLLTIRTQAITLDEAVCQASPFDIAPGAYVQVQIEDTGVGIEDSAISHIFEPFFTTKEVGRGTGLGLAAVYGTVKEHGGMISVESELGRGTVFTLCFPITDAPTIQTKKTVVACQLGTGTVLVVDDEPVMKIAACSMLEDLGYTVLSADNGHEGVEMYKAHQADIDLVLLDYVMPVMNGEECFRTLKALDADVKVILSSGFTPDGHIGDVLNSGILGFIKKPYCKTDLSQCIALSLKDGNNSSKVS